MTRVNERRSTAEFLVSEANGYRSRAVGTVEGGVAPGLVAGTVLGVVTSGGNYVAHDSGASDGSETAAAILYEATVGTIEATVIVRDAEVNGDHLAYESGADDAAKAIVNAALASVGIIVR